ncbi:MAG: protein-L-isoaspartate(D-aspartate) O-methyltransferase [Candidatus Krumholzibacteriota bacterium]|nr:protein-L-isoaspartate(D-aspartate) O-methyltransferase [Candidatus Krumholzibacteriota bacterium]
MGMETELDFTIARRRMVVEQLASRGITDERILDAFGRVPRHLFVDPAIGNRAYDDCSFPIGYAQTISQPYIQALMIQHLGVGPRDKVLEIGTGSGYQTAVLSLLCREVFSVERIGALSKKAAEILGRIDTGRIRLRINDGSSGWQFYSPYDRIIVSAVMNARPDHLIEQLADKGTLIAPVDSGSECLVLYKKLDGKFNEQRLAPCSFVPLLKGVE